MFLKRSFKTVIVSYSHRSGNRIHLTSKQTDFVAFLQNENNFSSCSSLEQFVRVISKKPISFIIKYNEYLIFNH